MKHFLRHLLLAIAALIFLSPLLWLVHASFQFPDGHVDFSSFENFHQLLVGQTYFRWMVNSLFLASLQTVLVVLLSSLTGFVLAKHRFFGRGFIELIMLMTMLLAAQVLLPGSYNLMFRLGWINSYLAIIIPGSVSVFGTFLFRQSMSQIPDDLLASARLDGCGELRLWWDISLPVVRPMIGAFSLLSFLAAWNSFLWPQIILQDESKYTLPLALNNLAGQSTFQHSGVLMSATLLGILPVILLFFALQNDFVENLTSGAIKE